MTAPTTPEWSWRYAAVWWRFASRRDCRRFTHCCERARARAESVIEVLAQLDTERVRGIALTPTQGLARGVRAIDSGAPLQAPVGGAAELQSVVRAMKALAAASVDQYEQSVRALSDYDRAVELGLAVCLRDSGPPTATPAFDTIATTRPVVAVVFGSDQGLVGQFNETISRYAVEALTARPAQAEVWAVGERAHARLSESGMVPTESFLVPTSVHAITPLIEQILVANAARHKEAVTGTLYLFHNRPGSDADHAPTSQRLLPLDELWRRQRAELPWHTRRLPEAIGDTTTLRALIREYLFVSLFKTCAESLASENQIRLGAMQRAEKNIDERLDSLNQHFHRLRQSGIDEDLFDLVSGSEALKSSGR